MHLTPAADGSYGLTCVPGLERHDEYRVEGLAAGGPAALAGRLQRGDMVRVVDGVCKLSHADVITPDLFRPSCDLARPLPCPSLFRARVLISPSVPPR